MSEHYTRMGLLRRFLKGCGLIFAMAIFSSVAVSALEMVPQQIIRVVVDYCLGGDPSQLPAPVLAWLESTGGREYVLSHLWAAAVLLIAVAGVAAVFRYLYTYLTTRGTEKMVKNGRNLLFEHIESLPYDWHMQNSTGDIIQRCTSDVNTLRDFVSEQLIQVIRIAVLILFTVICMALLNLRLSLIAILSVPLLLFFSYIFYHKIGHLFLQCDENEGVLSTITQENLTGVRVVRAFGRESFERERFRRQNNIYTDAWMRLCRLLAVYWGSSDLLVGIQIMLVVTVGSVFAVRGWISVGSLIAFVSYDNMLLWPVRRLGRMLSEMSKAGVSLDRLCYIMNSEPEHSDGTLEPPMNGDIHFDHVSFGYEEGEEILHDVTLTVGAGQTVGILGTTGSGKSTLMHLLSRLYVPDSGSISIGGIPLEQIRLPWLRSHIGMVLQEPYLFSRTLGENIGIARDADMDEIRYASKIADLDETVSHFSRGYETIVGERGVTLSGGQKQRTAIARTIVEHAPIMVFDDSLSAVDAETDARIRASLAKAGKEATVILISHRISTLMAADRIYVMDKGRIVEEGTHEELIRKPGLYQHIYEIQSAVGEEEMEAPDGTEEEKGGED